MWAEHEGMGWWWVMGSVWMVAFWAIIVGLVVWGVRSLSGRTGNGPPLNADPLEIVRERYARGDINREEYEEIIRTLQG